MRDGWSKQLRTLPFKNSSGEVIPPFAAMELDYFGESGKSACELLDSADLLWRCKKPSSTISTKRLVFNSWKPVPVDGHGDYQVDPYALVLADITTALSPDDECGPVSGSWYVQKTGSGLFFRSYDTGRAHYVSATIRTIWVSLAGGSDGGALIGITRAGGIAARSTTGVPHTFPSATVDLLDPDTGDYYTPNRTEVFYNSTSIAISAAHVVQGKLMNDSDRYFVDVDDCS